MPHVVFWSSPSGPAFERMPTLADAVVLVQQLRNDHDVTDAEVHELTAVPLNFRTVVVVEPAVADPAPATPSLAAFAAPVVDYAVEPTPFGGAVPGLEPDPVGPFRSLAVVGSQAAEVDDAPHLVGLPTVTSDELEPAGAFEPALYAVGELPPVEESAPDSSAAEDVPEVADIPAQPVSYAVAPDAPARSLGLFA